MNIGLICSKNYIFQTIYFLVISWVLAFMIPIPVLCSEKLDLTTLSLDQLMNVRVTSAARKSQKISDVSAAVYVISQKDIHRSGVTSIPEALRMVPGIEVARVDANKWAITSRGFNGLYASKLLVLLDGRSVYSPLFSGVYWDAQDTLLEDVDRIEVIRGPGATMWGANAVNGVINIITKKAMDTQGFLLMGGAGNEEKGFGGGRFGGTAGKDGYYRVYTKYYSRDKGKLPSGEDGYDDWDSIRAGFRLDKKISSTDSMTITGDIDDGDAGQILTTSDLASFSMRTFEDKIKFRGGNIRSLWERTIDNESDMRVQFYYDRTERASESSEEVRSTIDFDLYHHFALTKKHDFSWGFGYRHTRDRLNNMTAVTYNPDSRHDDLFSAFLQDEIVIIPDDLFLILGSKFEYNDYSGFEYQPNLRFLWKLNEDHSIWASVSRAVRTPNRTNEDVRINVSVSPPNTVVSILGNHNFDSEKLIAYELGYRFNYKGEIFGDIALFYNSYDDLMTREPGSVILAPPYLVIPIYMENKMEGSVYGIELSSKWNITNQWRVIANYSFLRIQLHADSTSLDANPEEAEGNSPRNQFHLQSNLNLPYNLEFDQFLYYKDNLSSKNVNNYIRMDARLGWKPSDKIEVAIIGQNLFDPQHLEYRDSFGGVASTEVERSIYAKFTLKFF